MLCKWSVAGRSHCAKLACPISAYSQNAPVHNAHTLSWMLRMPYHQTLLAACSNGRSTGGSLHVMALLTARGLIGVGCSRGDVSRQPAADLYALSLYGIVVDLTALPAEYCPQGFSLYLRSGHCQQLKHPLSVHSLRDWLSGCIHGAP